MKTLIHRVEASKLDVSHRAGRDGGKERTQPCVRSHIRAVECDHVGMRAWHYQISRFVKQSGFLWEISQSLNVGN